MNRLSPDDPSSFSRPDEAVVKHFHWDVTVHFEEEVLRGHVDLDVIRVKPEVEFLHLDSSDDLGLLEAFCIDSGQRLELDRSQAKQGFGVCTRIRLPLGKDTARIRVPYETNPDSAALLWMTKEQTSGKQQPYVYSISEAIHGRALLPCQDSPNVKSTFTAKIRVPKGLTSVVSAIKTGENVEHNGDKSFMFEQQIPMPIYGLALAVGDIECRRIGPRSHVWSEKNFLNIAATELADVEMILKTAEELLGPYVWGKYDILILPPSFPFAGMENPCLTFMSPTVLTDDKSLIDVMAHEICHSWTGNLVTTKNFEHFWLNEGFTVYLERKILGRLHGEDVRMFSALDGFKQLKYCIDIAGHENVLTKLVLNLDNVSPDDALSAVPYEKGHTLLYYLETLLGADAMDAFVKAYVDRFMYKSIDSEQWKSFMYEFFADKKEILDKADLDAWLFQPGMPPITPEYKSTMTAASYDLCMKWLQASDGEVTSFTKQEFDELNFRQKEDFFAQLLESRQISRRKMQHLSELYAMKESLNVELLFRWLRLGIRVRWEGIIKSVASYLEVVGQLRYVVPLFRDLGFWPEKRRYALKLYEKLRPNMMYIVRHSIDGLGLDN